MTRWATPVAAILLSGILTACGGTPECSKPRLYQQAVAGKRIEPPEGMDAVGTGREMTIPSASPQAPPPPGECIDAPPTLSTSSSGS